MTPSFSITRPPKPATRILMPLKSATDFNSLRNQPKLCPPVLPHRNADDAESVVHLVDQLLAVAEHVPGIVLARREAERQRAVEDQRRILADVVARIGVAAFDRGVRDRVEHLQAGHDLARREGVDQEFSVAHLADELRDRRRRAPQPFDALREARRQAPFDGRLLRDRGRCHSNREAGSSKAREIPAGHSHVSPP